jgi:hypothetical protein
VRRKRIPNKYVSKGVIEMLKILKLILAILVLTLTFKPAFAQSPEEDEYQGMVENRIIRTPNPGLDIDVWIDKGEGSTYHPGDDIRIYFRASRDCYVVIYNLDTRGYVNILYPFNRSDDPWVEGGRVYRIPGRYDDYSLTVDGPSGVEYVQAVASLEPIYPPHWPGYYRGTEAEPEEINVLRMDEDEDPYVFMGWVNHRISPDPYFATDITNFYVRYPHPQWYYWPHQYWHYPDPFPYYLGSVYFWAPFGVEVYIDGVFYGIAPITIPAIIVGRHYVTYYYNGCRVWNDYVYVERSKTVRVDAKISQRIKYVSEDPVKKEYRSWKEKEYRYVKDKITSPVEKQVRSRTDYYEDKSPRQDRVIEQKKGSINDRGRDFVPEKGRVEEKRVKDREIASEKVRTKEKEIKAENVPQKKSNPEARSPESAKYEQKSREIHKERSSQTNKERVEVKRNKTERKR